MHPIPAGRGELRRHFKRLDSTWEPIVRPNVKGESIDELHERVAFALAKIIEISDREGVKAIVLSSHAAAIIAIGRVLTGRMPGDVTELDFYCFTAGLSTFVRKSDGDGKSVAELGGEGRIPDLRWRGGKGVGGGWKCTGNSDCSFLSGGEERGW